MFIITLLYRLLSVWRRIAFLKIPTCLKTGLKIPCVCTDEMRFQTQIILNRVSIHVSTWCAVECGPYGGRSLVVRDLSGGAHAAPRPHLLSASSGPPHHWHLMFPKRPPGRDAILLRTSDLKEILSSSSSSVIQSSCYILAYCLSLLLCPCFSTHQTQSSRISFMGFSVFLFLPAKPSSCCFLWLKDHECYQVSIC